MKTNIFTVGLDQKPQPASDAADSVSLAPTEKNAPPSYVSDTFPRFNRNEMVQQPIIVQRKSRGYKGILLVMLFVFLVAVFALTISEIAYNRQRDENFFRLRWAELKNGYGSSMDPHSAIAMLRRKIFNLKTDEYEPPADSLYQRKDPRFQSVPEKLTTTTAADVEPDPKPFAFGSVSSGSAGASRSSQQSLESEQQTSGFLGNANSPLRELRLKFLQNILQKIKKHAEDMGFDGTMQVSVIEVEPQQMSSELNDHDLGGTEQQQRPPLPQSPFMPQQQPFKSVQFPPSMTKEQRQNSFLDGFGEVLQPLFMRNNEVEQAPRRPSFNPFQRFQSNELFNRENFGMMPWPRPLFFRQPNLPWQMNDNNEQHRWGNQNFEHPPMNNFEQQIHLPLPNQQSNMPVSFEFPQQQQQQPLLPSFPQNQFKPFQQKPEWMANNGNQNQNNGNFFPPSPPPQQQSQVIPAVLHFQEADQPQTNAAPKPENLRPMIELFPQQSQSSIVSEGGAPKAVIEGNFEQKGNFAKQFNSDIERPAELMIGDDNANKNGNSDNNNNSDNKNEKTAAAIDEWAISPPNFEFEKEKQAQQQSQDQEFSSPSKTAQIKLEKDNESEQQPSQAVNPPPLFFQVDDPAERQQSN